MTSGRDWDATAAALRQAVIEGRYTDAKALLTDYTHAIPHLRNPEAAAEARGLIEWARKLTLGQKAAAAARLAALPRGVSAYRAVRMPGAHTWDLLG